MRLIISTMKDEGPFILEWLAYYLSIGFTHFIVNSNDCSDGTDRILSRCAELGFLAHIDNPPPWKNGPQGAAYANAMRHPWFKQAEWIMVCDADEFLDIRVGDGTLDDLFAAAPRADGFAAPWQMFGHNGIVEFEDRFIISQMTRASEMGQLLPQNLRSVKSLFRNNSTYRAISTHRPRRPVDKRLKNFVWVDGDGDVIPDAFKRRGWSFSTTGLAFGKDMFRMNHYAVRSLESYLMKRLRGDVRTREYHPKMESSGRVYWEQNCWNLVPEMSILGKVARMQKMYAKLKSDPVLGALHDDAVRYHKDRIAEIRQTPTAHEFTETYSNFKGQRTVFAQDNIVIEEGFARSLATLEDAEIAQAAWINRALHKLKSKNVRRDPWCGVLDSLGVPDDSDTLRGKITLYKDDISKIPLPYDPGDPALAPDTPDRFVKTAARRARFLRDIGGKSTWLLIGQFEDAFVQECLDQPSVKQLSIVAPWGLSWKGFDWPQGVAIDPALQAQDRAFFSFLKRFDAPIRAGRLRVYRALPLLFLKLLRPQSVGVVIMRGVRRHHVMRTWMDRVDPALEYGGTLAFTSYKVAGAPSADTMAAIHEFIGRNATRYRVDCQAPPWLALKKLPPLAQARAKAEPQGAQQTSNRDTQ